MLRRTTVECVPLEPRHVRRSISSACIETNSIMGGPPMEVIPPIRPATLNQKRMLRIVRGFRKSRPGGTGRSSFGLLAPQFAYTRYAVMKSKIPDSDNFSTGPSNRIISSWPTYVQTIHGSETAAASHGSMDFWSSMICNYALAISITVMLMATAVSVPSLRPSM